MARIYTNNGQGISTKITNKIDGKKYIVSTAKDSRGPWQLGIFHILFEIPFIYGKADYSKSYPGPISKTFKEAERIHGIVEEIATNQPVGNWLGMMAPLRGSYWEEFDKGSPNLSPQKENVCSKCGTINPGKAFRCKNEDCLEILPQK